MKTKIKTTQYELMNVSHLLRDQIINIGSMENLKADVFVFLCMAQVLHKKIVGKVNSALTREISFSLKRHELMVLHYFMKGVTNYETNNFFTQLDKSYPHQMGNISDYYYGNVSSN